MTAVPTPRLLLCDEPPLLIKGSDTRVFLNRLLTINVRALGEGEGQATHLLNATGRLSASLFLTQLGGVSWLAIPRTLSASELLQKLDLYLFGEDVQLMTSDWVGVRLICSPPQLDQLTDALGLKGEPAVSPVTGAERGWAVLRSELESEREEAEVLLRADRWARDRGLIELEWWGARARRDELVATLQAQGAQLLSAQDAEDLRLQLGAPDRPEYQERYTPLDVEGSSTLLSVSEGKGCYPGQEVIERTLALGQPARQLAHLRVAVDGDSQLVSSLGSAPLNHPLYSSPERSLEVGELTSISPKVSADGARYGLALLKRKHVALKELYTAQGAKLIVVSTPPVALGEGEVRDER